MKAIIINEYGDESVVISTDVERPIPVGREKVIFHKNPNHEKLNNLSR